MAGISGTKDKGCNSLVLAGGYSDDKDLGYEFTYSGKVSKIHINTLYLTDSYISFTLKLESGQNFCSNRSIRSSTSGKKNIFEIPPCGSHFF